VRHAALIFMFMLLNPGCESREKTTVQTTNNEMRTFPIGRHLIDLPKGFELAGVSAIFTPVGMNEDSSTFDLMIKPERVTQSEFSTFVVERRSAILNAAGARTDILKEEKSLGNDAVLFRILEIKESFKSELHLLKGERYLRVKTDSFNSHFLEAEDRLTAFASNISLLTPSPESQTGFCLGPFMIKGTYEGEYATLSFRDQRRPDIVISVEINTYTSDETKTLLQSVSGPDSLLTIFDAGNKVLRKGELEVAGMHAQEWLSWIKLGNDRDEKHFGFALETIRAKPGPTQPHLRLELDTGEYDSHGTKQPNSLSDHDAMALWDSIVKSIRLRPVAN
jgi:hypothetical protein